MNEIIFKKTTLEKNITFFGIGIIGIIFWLTSTLVSNVKRSELEKIGLWSQAIKKKARTGKANQ